jgi:hypothetical protein
MAGTLGPGAGPGKDSGPSFLRFSVTQSLDVSSVVPVGRMRRAVSGWRQRARRRERGPIPQCRSTVPPLPSSPAPVSRQAPRSSAGSTHAAWRSTPPSRWWPWCAAAGQTVAALAEQHAAPGAATAGTSPACGHDKQQSSVILPIQTQGCMHVVGRPCPCQCANSFAHGCCSPLLPPATRPGRLGLCGRLRPSGGPTSFLLHSYAPIHAR